jgi:hypothetical protein
LKTAVQFEAAPQFLRTAPIFGYICLHGLATTHIDLSTGTDYDGATAGRFHPLGLLDGLFQAKKKTRYRDLGEHAFGAATDGIGFLFIGGF